MATICLSSAAAPSPDRLQDVQRRRKLQLRVLFGLSLFPILITDSLWHHRGSALYDAIEWIGLLLIFSCIAGRTWCSLYIGGRKKRELVTAGPYSLVRNPLYVFTVLGALGIGAQSGSLLVAAWAALLVFCVHRHVVQDEEAFLAREFPAEFAAYAERVPRFWPRFAGWRDVEELTIKPHLVRQTFLDACLFLLSIPAADVFETLQRSGEVPTLLFLP